MEGYMPWMGAEVEQACEDCPLFAAQAEMTISRDLEGEYRYETKLTLGDSLALVGLMTKGADNERQVVNGKDCSGPTRTMFGLGRKACRGRLTTMIPAVDK